MPIPVTIITGYLGAGKTTLLNAILTGDHGRRIAVVQNEFGEVGIDHDLLMHVEEDIAVMSNGCICCTMRDDMVEAIEMLIEGGRAIDQIIIETTGLASPASVVMTLLTHPDAGETFTLDGVVTLADAAHLALQLGRSPEVADQLAYADLILLNKIDLVDAGALPSLEESIRRLNPTARIVRTAHAAADLDAVLDLGGFDAARLSLAGADTGAADTGDTDTGDTDTGGTDTGGTEAGDADTEAGGHGHRHEAGVGSVSMRERGEIDQERFDRWIESLLRDHHETIYRMKGIIRIAGQPRRYIFQGVHSLSSWQYDRRWGAGEEESRFVVIGRDLDADALREGFRGCLVQPASVG